MLRVIVADDHPVVREGLRAMLDAEPDLEVVGEAGSGAEAVALAARLRPDVVLMDLRMPGTDGVEATGRIVASGDARVLVVTTYDTDADILRAVEAGATGYLLKDVPLPQLADAVRAAARGETVLAPPVAARLVSRMRAPAAEAPTPRELEVLKLVATGMNNRDIAKELFISENTVKNHVRNILEKLQLHSRMEAVMYAVREKLLDLP